MALRLEEADEALFLEAEHSLRLVGVSQVRHDKLLLQVVLPDVSHDWEARRELHVFTTNALLPSDDLWVIFDYSWQREG